MLWKLAPYVKILKLNKCLLTVGWWDWCNAVDGEDIWVLWCNNSYSMCHDFSFNRTLLLYMNNQQLEMMWFVTATQWNREFVSTLAVHMHLPTDGRVFALCTFFIFSFLSPDFTFTKWNSPPCFFFCFIFMWRHRKTTRFPRFQKISNLIHSRSHPTSAARPLHCRPSDQPVVFSVRAFFLFIYLFFI